MRMLIGNIEKKDAREAPNNLGNRRHLLMAEAFLLCLASGLILWTLWRGELYGPDTWQHAITGIFLSDFLKDWVFLRNFSDMLEYTWTYYARYPAIGLLHWPPLFHATEGIYFLFADLSEPSARFLILLFFLAAIIFYHRIMIRLFDPYVALVAAIFFLASPLVLTYARIVSLEIPSLALSLGSICFFLRYLHGLRFRDGVLAAVFAGLALLTKQTCVFLLVFYGMVLGLAFLKKEPSQNLSLKNILVFFGIIVVLAGPFYILAFYFHGGTISKDVFIGTTIHHPYFSLSNYLYYISSIRHQLPLVLLPLIVIFIVAYFVQYKKAASPPVNFLLMWVLSCYVLFTLIAQKESRYIIYWVPAFTGLAAVGLMKGANFILQSIHRPKPFLRFLLPLPIMLIVLVQALTLYQPYTGGYDEVASYVVAQTAGRRNEIVFYDGNDHGSFTFSIRKHDPQRRMFVFRSSKYLYATNIYSEYETWDIRTSKEDIVDFFRKYGIRFVVLSFNSETHLPPVKNLRALVEDRDKFSLVKKFPVTNSDCGKGEVSVYLFKESPSAVQAGELEIPMPTLGKTIKIRLKDKPANR